MTDILDRSDTPPAGPGDEVGSGAEPAPAPSPRGSLWRLILLIGVLSGLGLLFGWSLLAVVGVLIVSIFLHESGHYLVARATGMKVSEFFISFGPRIWSFRRGETEYGLKSIPAGAYVRIVGMSNLEEIDPADEDRTYRAKSYPKRLAVVLAGPFANIALGLVLMVVVFMGWGVAGDAWKVHTVVAGSAAASAGIQPGDQIVSVDGVAVTTWDQFGAAVTTHQGDQIDVVVVRDGQQLTVPVTTGWRLGDGAAASLPPLVPGDIITSVNGQPITTYQAFTAALAGQPAGTADIVFERGLDSYRTQVDVPVQLPADGADGFFGVSPDIARKQLGLLPAVGESVKGFGTIVGGVSTGLANFLSPSGLKNYANLVSSSTDPTSNVTVAGSHKIVPVDSGAPAAVDPANDPATSARPVSILGIGRLLGQAAQSGWASFVLLLAGFNLMVGLFNLLPLPPLDGGHALVATYEAIRGKIAGRAYRVDMARLMPITYVVVFLLVGLGLTSIWLDAVKPINNPYGP